MRAAKQPRVVWKVEFRNDDMRNLSTAPIDSYDAIIAMDNAVPHLQSDDDIKMAFGVMRARLRRGGIALIKVCATHGY